MPHKIEIHGVNKAILTVEVSTSAIMLVRGLEGPRRWLKDGGLSFIPSKSNIAHIQASLPKAVVTHLQPEIEAPARIKTGERPLFETKYAMFEYQKIGQNKMQAAPGLDFALFCEPGTGKTKMALDRAAILWCDEVIDWAIVVAPSGVHTQWVLGQIPEHLAMPHATVHWLTGKTNHKGAQSFKPEHLGIVVVNYAGLNTKNGRIFMANYLKENQRPFMLIMDESHYVKNTSAARWKNANALARDPNCVARLAMTGTPIAKNLLDEWAQLRILDEDILGIRFKSHFRNEYCIMGGFEGRQVVGHRNLEKFKEKTDPYVYRVKKEGLPSKIYKEWRFKMADKQLIDYGVMAKNLIAEIEEGVYLTVDNAMVATGKLQQISNGFMYYEEDGKQLVKSGFDSCTKNPRLLAMEEYIDAPEQHGERILIWCRYTQDQELIKLMLDMRADDPYVSLETGMSPGEREKVLHSWNHIPLEKGGPRFLVCKPSLGGTGLNLHEGGCARVLYYSNSENSIHRWQSEDRVHRVGIKRPVIYTDLVAMRSRDRAILANLREKKNLSDMRLDDLKEQLEAALDGSIDNYTSEFNQYLATKYRGSE